MPISKFTKENSKLMSYYDGPRSGFSCINLTQSGDNPLSSTGYYKDESWEPFLSTLNMKS